MAIVQTPSGKIAVPDIPDDEQRRIEAEELRRKQAEYEASLVTDEYGNRYEQTIVNGKLALRLVESADGTLNI